MVGLRQEGVRLQNLMLDAERKIVSIVPDRYTRTERSPQGDLSVFSKQQLHKLRQAYEVSAGELFVPFREGTTLEWSFSTPPLPDTLAFEAEMTVGSSSTFDGYDASSPTIGSISSDTFEVGGVEYTVSQVSYRTASVSWEAPESNGGSLLSGYKIQWQSVDAEEGTTPQIKHVYFDDYSDEARPTEVSETIDGLTDGVEYTVRVLAYNPNGDGPAAEVTVSESNAAPTGLPEISGTPQVGETLTADTSPIADEDGLDDVSYSYQWIQSDGNDDTDVEGEASSTYTLVAADEGRTIKVRVSFTDDADNQESLTSVATVAVAAKPNTAATGLPAISGTPQVGETLTASTSAIADGDGLDNVSYGYQWVQNDGIADTDIEDATDAAYTLTDDDVAKTIKVRVTFTDDADNEETLTSAATEVVQQGGNAWSATMTVETRDGYTGYSHWGDPDLGSLSETAVEWDGKTHYVRYLFLKDGELWLGLNEEMFSTGFVLSVGDEEFGSADAMVDKSGGASYRFRWDDPGLGWSDGNEVSVNLVRSDQNTPALGAPTISGKAQVDETLTADTLWR